SIAELSADFDIIGHSFFNLSTPIHGISEQSDTLLDNIVSQGTLRISLQVQEKEMIATFSPIWAGGIEYYIVTLERATTIKQ
ncbi:MAG TPA: hypothetical protein PLW09_14055, partial [Candidatus Kapabacteria bacterium]|nr:hypothetical protein [Candidatus Kapabacteria bacterium]